MRSSICIALLAGTVALTLGVMITGATLGSTKRVPNGKQALRPEVVNARLNFEEAVAKGDEAFLKGDVTGALARYQSSKALRTLPFGSDLKMKIATCMASMNRYPEAVAAFKDAEQDSPVAASTGLIDAQVAYLAYLNGDVATLDTLITSALDKYVTDGARRRDISLVSGPGRSNVREAQVYLVFARAFVAAYQREGADFAYSRALALSGGEPSIAREHGFFLRSRFRDPAAEIRVLSSAKHSIDTRLQKDIEHQMKDARANLDSYASASHEVRTHKEAAYRTFGVASWPDRPSVPVDEQG